MEYGRLGSMKLAREAEERLTEHTRSLAPRLVLFRFFRLRPIRCGGTLEMGIKTRWLDVAFRLHGWVDMTCTPQQYPALPQFKMPLARARGR